MADAADDGLREGVQIARLRLVEGESTAFAIADGDPLLAAVGRSVGRVDDSAAIDWFGADGATLDETMGSERDPDGNWRMTFSFGMNGVTWMPDHNAGPEQAEAGGARRARLGDTLRWEVRNDSPMAHPYHLHGFNPAVRARRWPDPEDPDSDGTAVRIAWPHDEFEDTVVLPGFSSLYFCAVLADPAGDGSAAGRWMQRCHILQHGENGMMSELVVAP